jgi:hypothetical protein
MFDPQTVELIRAAPPLDGRELEQLPKQLTEAYSRIVSLRMRLREILTEEIFQTELGDMVRQLESIALTQEAFVTATPDRANRASAAFVAASAHQLRFSTEKLLASEEEPSRLSLEAIAPEIASTLMFLISGRAADAAQMARNIRSGDLTTVEGILRQSVIDLARGQLGAIVNRTWTAPAEMELSDGTATLLLWTELLRGVQGLAARLLGNADAPAQPNSADVFAAVRDLSVDEIAFDGTAQVFSVFSGPHHLALQLRGYVHVGGD